MGLAFTAPFIYDILCISKQEVYFSMSITVSKWGNSLGIRIPAVVANALSVKSGDVINFEIKDDSVLLKKEKTTKQMFEEFYGKSFSKITKEDIGGADLVDFGEDIGSEVF